MFRYATLNDPNQTQDENQEEAKGKKILAVPGQNCFQMYEQLH